MRFARVCAFAVVACAAISGGGCDEPQSNDPPISTEVIAHLNAGAGLMGQFEFEKARVAFEAALAIDPTNPYAKIDAAIAQLNQSAEGSQALALEKFTALVGDPTVGLRATYCAALAQLFLGDCAAALKSFTRVSTEDPTDAYAAYYTGQCLELAGDLTGAATQYERAEQLDPYLRSAVLGQQRVLARLDQPERAAEKIALFDKLAANPRSTLAQFKYSRMGPLAEVFLPVHRTREFAHESSTGGPGPLLAPTTTLDVEGWPTELKELGLASTIDLNGDGATDLVWRAKSADSFKMVPILAPVDGSATGKWRAVPNHPIAQIPSVHRLWWGDLNNDGRVDAVVERRKLKPTDDLPLVSWAEQGSDGQWSLRDFNVPVVEDNFTVVLALADFDHDGDIDVLVSGRSGDRVAHVRILYNLSNGAWEVVDLPIDPERVVLSVTLIDIDSDGDLDILASSFHFAKSRATVLLNDRLWKWSRNEAKYGAFESALAMDAVAYASADSGTPMVATLEWASDRGTGPYSNLALWSFDADGPRRLTKKYFGLAGWIAAVDVTGTGEKSILVGGRNLNRALTWLRSPDLSVTVFDASGDEVDQITSPDGDRDGLLAPAILAESGFALFDEGFRMLAPGSGRKPIATIEFKGRIDPAQQMRSNSSGIGTTAVARIERRWSSLAQLPWNSFSSQSTDPCIVGLGTGRRRDAKPASDIDFLSIDWPDGVTQSELNLAPGAHTIVETQRQISSCPVIFAWNGSKMEFVTDSLGVGGLGYLASVSRDPGGRLDPIYAPPRPWERIAISEIALAPITDSDGAHYEIALSEPMEEMTALDRAALKAFDLPPGWSMSLDERMGISDPQPTGEAIYWRDSQLPVRATVVHGSSQPLDQTAAITSRDGVAVDPGTIDPRFIGKTAQPFALTLEFAEPIASGEFPPVLLMDGWIEYPYCQTNFAMWQAGAVLSPPTFEALDPATGEWALLVKEYGYPAGMPREAAFPLDAARIPRNCKVLRISTNNELYIDRCRVVYREACPQAIELDLELDSARVREGGFAKRIPAAQRRPIYDYSARVPLWDCRKQAGWYTRSDIDCTPLVDAVDDAVAIFGAGEEVRMSFATSIAPVQSGWTRTFVLDLNGWCKDMDFLTNEGLTIAPLPTRSGDAAPTPSRDALHREFNTRYEAGR